MVIVIKRLLRKPEYTLGLLKTWGFTCFTLELPWRDNKRQISCIPVGGYELKIEDHSTYGKVFRLLNVPDRDGILIHPLNKSSETQGCIGLGHEFSLKQEFLMHSKWALQDLMNIVKDEKEILLSITESLL